MPLLELFDGVEGVITKKGAKKAAKSTQDKAVIRGQEFIKTPRGAEVIRAFGAIEDEGVLADAVALVKSLAGEQ